MLSYPYARISLFWQSRQPVTLRTEDIRIRDPYLLADQESRTYYLYAQIGNRLTEADAPKGVEVYTSKDLKTWTQPQPVLVLPDKAPSWKSVWAPEVHEYQGKYYLFVTLTSEQKITDQPNPVNGEIQWKRGTHVFRSDSPLGPFIPLREGAHTPAEWMSLDGTLYVEEGQPYMIFCHEWAQTLDGTVEIVPLTPDLSAPAGPPKQLFQATDATWVRNMQDVGIKRNGYVTDGPAFYRNTRDELIMVWSSFGDHQYAIGQAISRSGSVFGPWEQIDEPLVGANGGHGMIFRDFSGRWQLAYHQPNGGGQERLHLRPVRENREALLSLDRPNIVLIMVDDMGWSDIGCYGGEIPTPRIDALAERGLRFNQFYNNARCCPTRASLMTGLYAHQAGIGQMSEDPYHERLNRHDYGTFGYRGYLNRNSVTLAEVLRENGYHTYMTGKWHLGMHGDEKKPLQRGFEKYYGTLAGASSYFKPQGGRCLYEGDDPLPPPEDPDYYTTDAYTDKAIAYLRAQSDDRPFFLYLAYNAPHWPLHAKPADIERFKRQYLIGWDSVRRARQERQIAMDLVEPEWGLSIRDQRVRPWTELSPGEQDSVAYRMAVYAAQVYAVDYNVGKLVDHLQANDQLDNTLIIFLADNGACAETYDELGSRSLSLINDPDFSGAVSYGIGWANASNTPFFEYKVKPYEGGLSTPLILHYPKLIDAQRGKITDAKGHITDIMPTLVDLSGGVYPTKSAGGDPIQPTVGRSLVPVMHTGRRAEPEYMFWEHQSYGAVRHGDWKAIVDLRANTWELFNLKSDRTEKNNLAWEQPDLVQELATKWYDWALNHHVFPKKLTKQEAGGGE